MILDKEEESGENVSHVPFASPSASASSLNDADDEPKVAEKGAPHLVDMSPDEVLQLITSFHDKRIQWDFPTDPTDFPF